MDVKFISDLPADLCWGDVLLPIQRVHHIQLLVLDQFWNDFNAIPLRQPVGGKSVKSGVSQLVIDVCVFLVIIYDSCQQKWDNSQQTAPLLKESLMLANVSVAANSCLTLRCAYLCTVSANCALWKSAASRRISSQSAAIFNTLCVCKNSQLSVPSLTIHCQASWLTRQHLSA